MYLEHRKSRCRSIVAWSFNLSDFFLSFRWFFFFFPFGKCYYLLWIAMSMLCKCSFISSKVTTKKRKRGAGRGIGVLTLNMLNRMLFFGRYGLEVLTGECCHIIWLRKPFGVSLKFIILRIAHHLVSVWMSFSWIQWHQCSVLFNLILFIGNLMSVLIKLAGSLMMVTRIHLCMSVPPITEERLASSLYCVTLYITQYTLNWRVKMTYSSLCSCHHHFVAIVA